MSAISAHDYFVLSQTERSLSAVKLGRVNYPAVRGRGHICRVTRIRISSNQCMHVTGSYMFRSTVPISKIMSSNEVILLAVGTRGVTVQQIM